MTASPTNSALTYKVGDIVLLKKTLGVVCYIGPVEWNTKDKTAIYIGLELIEAITNGHNGSYLDNQYYDCKPGHGIIVNPKQIIRKIDHREIVQRLSVYRNKIQHEKQRKKQNSNILQIMQNVNTLKKHLPTK